MGTILGGILGAIFMTMVPELLKIGVGWITPFISERGAIPVARPDYRFRRAHRLVSVV
jgi:hypothetical protein